MRIFWRDASVGGTVTSENGTADGFSVLDLQRSNLDPVWKSKAVETSERINIDLGSAQTIEGFALLNHDLATTADTANVTITYASDSGFTTGLGSIGALNVTDTNWYQYFAAISRQFWRITIPKLGADTDLQPSAGRLMLGPVFTPSHGVRPGYLLGPGSATSRIVETTSGGKYGSLGVTPRVLSGTMPGLSDADFDEINLLQSINQNVVPFIVSLNWESAPVRETIYGAFTRVRPMTNVAVVKREFTLSIKELL